MVLGRSGLVGRSENEMVRSVYVVNTRNSGRSVFAGLAISLSSSLALAGGSSEQTVLIIDPTDPSSLEVGHYYALRRNIPASNILYMKPGASNFTTFGTTLAAFQGELAVRGVETSVDFIIIAPNPQYRVAAPGLLSDVCFPVSNFSIASCYTMAFIRNEVLSGTLSVMHPNQYASGAFSSWAFDSQTTYAAGNPSTGSTARRYFAAGLLGHTGEFGNTVQELKDMIDRSVAVDGTRPTGTFYFMNTTDAARNVRSAQFAAVVTTINNSLGGTAVTLNGVLPPSASDVMGVMTGVSNFDWSTSGSTIMAGAFCDHLTSFAATFNGNGQTTVDAWIRAGASGSAGAIEEPCNYQGKFPQARIHAFYRQGMCLAEAYLRSVQYVPFQGLLYGDPLTRPYAWPPNLNVAGVPGGPASGTVVITPTGTATLSGRQIDRFELFINGASRGTVLPGGSFNVNTFALPDGWHEVRLLTWDNSLAKHTRSWTGPLVVSNDAIVAGLNPPANTIPTLNDSLTFGLSAAGAGVRELRLLANGRVVATRTAAGPVTVFGRNLGPGHVKVQCEVMFEGNYTARSAPVEMNIMGEGTPGPTVPVAHSHRKRMLRTRGAAVELPATFADALGTASYELVTPPANATLTLAGATAMVIPGAAVTSNDSFQFRVTTPSGTSNTATVTLWYACEGDFDGDGATTVPDIFAFLSAWFSGSPVADVDDSGGAPAVPDIFAFLSSWFAGCQ